MDRTYTNRKRASLPGLLLLSLLVALPCSPQAVAQPSGVRGQDRFDGVRDIIRRKLSDGSTPSVTVAVAQRGKIIWEEGFGWADREKRIPATPNTAYSLASVSKPFTATALMTLVQAGKIDLDRPVDDYLGPVKLKAWVG